MDLIASNQAILRERFKRQHSFNDVRKVTIQNQRDLDASFSTMHFETHSCFLLEKEEERFLPCTIPSPDSRIKSALSPRNKWNFLGKWSCIRECSKNLPKRRRLRSAVSATLNFIESTTSGLWVENPARLRARTLGINNVKGFRCRSNRGY